MVQTLQHSRNFLKIEPTGNANNPWEMVYDMDYAGDPVSKRIISGFILHVLGVPVTWRSKSQKSILLSSSDTENIALLRLLKR